MHIFTSLRYSEWNLKRKLFGYMLILGGILLTAFTTGLLLFGKFDSAEKRIYESLDIQMDIFEKELSSHFDHLAAASIQLSESLTLLLEDQLYQWNTDFKSLNNDQNKISQLQEAMINTLQHKLMLEDCSGVFVMLDATVNTSLEQAHQSRTGLYLQVNGYETFDQGLLLYRGLSEIGKAHGVMPHRKWHLEFRTDQFPNYEEIVSTASLPLTNSYWLTDLTFLPGTSDQVMLLVVPMIGSDGTFYGLCGCEISTSFFLTHYAQPSKLSHLTCLLTTGDDRSLDADAGLSCGVNNGYHRIPSGKLTLKPLGDGLLRFCGNQLDYVGITRKISLTPNNDAFTLAVMILGSDYDREITRSTLQTLILWLLLLFFAINCCLFFSRRFLTPVLKGLEQIKSEQWTHTPSTIPEINDLFAFLAEKDREHEAHVNTLKQEKQTVQDEKERLQNEYAQAQSRFESAQTQVTRLAYSRKQEIDPADYEQFLAGIHTLTPAEQKIFGYYLAGKTVKEIIEILSIKESTLRYHNQNIYSKLGVNSLKQLLRYAALMQQESCPRIYP